LLAKGEKKETKIAGRNRCAERKKLGRKMGRTGIDRETGTRKGKERWIASLPCGGDDVVRKKKFGPGRF